jgi:mRNA-degrading endonuclease RelE of RelBE toxin-antitoxin system
VTDDRWALRFANRAERDLRRLDRQTQQRVLAALTSLLQDPYGGTLRKPTGRQEWRLRIGDRRAIVELRPKDRVIYVKHVLPRGRAYDR